MDLTAMGLLAGSLIASLLIGLLLIAHGSIARTRWGINPDPVICPRCNTALSYIRRPQSLQQSLWGGYTCPNCGCEVDKWGRELPVRKDDARAAHDSRHDRPTALPKSLLRNALIFALAVYAAQVLSEQSPTMLSRLLHPIASVILSTLAFTLVLMALGRISRRARDKQAPPL
jgi:hypothetical protein